MAQSAIPTARVNRIIKADKDVRLCSKEAVYLISRAAVSLCSHLLPRLHLTRLPGTSSAPPVDHR